jgi:GlcNAc-P-P-Und epimerase
MRRVLVTGGSGFIGRRLVPHLLASGYTVANFDVAPPAECAQRVCWREGSILDRGRLETVCRDFKPNCMVHLAALAVMEGRSLDDFKANTEGTANALTVVRALGDVERLVITSSQHVRRPGSGPAAHDEDYAPHGLYGESKIITEQLTRQAGLAGHWTIIRPTAVWGPNHPFHVEALWRLIFQDRYVHPSHDPVVRAYGYVENVVWQIERILALPASLTNGRTLYVGDENVRQIDWVNGFSRALSGREVRTAPLPLIRGLAWVGDGFRACGLRFPMYSERLFNLVTPNPVPMQPTFDVLGHGPFSMEKGIAETAAWLVAHYRQPK